MSATMRLKSEIWVKAYLRRCAVNGAMAVVARRGDVDAGAIFIKVQRRDGRAVVFAPAPAGRDDADYGRRFIERDVKAGADGLTSEQADDVLAREARFDSDIWVVDVEDATGRHFLGDDLVT